MLGTKLNKDSAKLDESWIIFLDYVRSEIEEIDKNLKIATLEVRKLERLKRAFTLGCENVELLIKHKDTIIAFDESLKVPFSLLEAYKKRNNLNNDAAIIALNQILNSTPIKSSLNILDELKNQIEKLESHSESLKDILYGDAFEFDVITNLFKKYNINEDIKRNVLWYITKRTAKKKSVVITRVKEESKERNNQTTEIILEEIIDKNQSEELDSDSNKAIYDEYMVEYEEIKKSIQDLMVKYYGMISNLTPALYSTYNGYTSVADEDLSEDMLKGLNVDFSEAIVIIEAIKLFDARMEIEDINTKIVENNYQDKEEIEYLGAYIEEFKNIGKRLLYLDRTQQEEIKIENEETVDNLIYLKDSRGEVYFEKDLEKIDNSLKGYAYSLLSKIKPDSKENFKKVMMDGPQIVKIYELKNSFLHVMFTELSQDKFLVIGVDILDKGYDTIPYRIDQRSFDNNFHISSEYTEGGR